MQWACWCLRLKISWTVKPDKCVYWYSLDVPLSLLVNGQYLYNCFSLDDHSKHFTAPFSLLPFIHSHTHSYSAPMGSIFFLWGASWGSDTLACTWGRLGSNHRPSFLRKTTLPATAFPSLHTAGPLEGKVSWALTVATLTTHTCLLVSL